MNASKQAADLIEFTLGHSAYRIKSSQRGWNYREEQECEWLVLEVLGEPANAVVLFECHEARINFASEAGFIKAERTRIVAQQGVAEARNANERMKSFQIEAFASETPKYIRRVFIFETDDGLEYGFHHEEFGGIEPFLSVKV
jgi:hypothetical protein